MDCARYVEETLDKLLLSEKSGTYKDERELIFMEHFINMADKDIVAKIRPKRLNGLKREATWAGDRILNLRVSSLESNGGTPFVLERPAEGASSYNKALY